MIYCPNCGTANREGSKYCNQCGARLSPEEGIRCQICGTVNPLEQDRCLKCGASLKFAPVLEEKPPEELPHVPVFPEEVISEIPEEELPDFLSDLRLKVQEMAMPEEEKPGFIPEEEYSPEEKLPLTALEERKPPVIVEYPEEELPDWLKEAEMVVPPAEPFAPAEWLKEVEIPWLEDETVEVPVLAEIPPWLEALRPVERPSEVPSIPEEEAEEEGALKGLKGLLKPATIFMPPERISIRRERAEPGPGREEIQKLIKLAPIAPSVKIRAPARKVRTHRLIYFILFLAVLIPLLLGWPSIPSGSPPTPPGVEALFQTVEALPENSPVLVAFDYEPYMAGEMEMIASPVLVHLKDRGCLLSILSLNPTGPALAQGLMEKLGFRYGEEFVNLGYIPAVEASLRALGVSVKELVVYDYLYGEPLDSFQAFQGMEKFADWKLVVMLSAQSPTLVGWIEQVGSIHQVPMVAVVIAGLKSYAEPYLNSGQLKGLLGGATDAAFYEALRGKLSESARAAPVQAFAIVIALFIILAGSLIRGKGAV